MSILLTGEKISPFIQSQMTKQAKLTVPFQESIKGQDQRRNQIKALQTLKPANQKFSIKDAIPEDQLYAEAKA